MTYRTIVKLATHENPFLVLIYSAISFLGILIALEIIAKIINY